MTPTLTPTAMAALHAAAFVSPRPWNAAEFSALLQSPGVFAVSEPTGFLLARAVADEAEILTLAVAPAARRCGCAGRLLDRFIAQAARQGAVTAFLEVAADNRAALALYGKAGFTRKATRRGYYTGPDGSPVDAVILSRALA